MTDDDQETVQDLEEAVRALEKAIIGVNGQDQDGRDILTWGVGFALGRLMRVRSRFLHPPKLKE